MPDHMGWISEKHVVEAEESRRAAARRFGFIESVAVKLPQCVKRMGSVKPERWACVGVRHL